MRIVREPLTREEIQEFAREDYGGLVKAVVDVRRRIMAVGGQMHADEEAALLDDGSKQDDLWGINLFLDRPREERVEFDSLINIRPSQGNRSRGVDDPETRAAIEQVVVELVRE